MTRMFARAMDELCTDAAGWDMTLRVTLSE
jgi:hypothetical protein